MSSLTTCKEASSTLNSIENLDKALLRRPKLLGQGQSMLFVPNNKPQILDDNQDSGIPIGISN